jgi:inorganic pyrophosphatase
MLYRSHPWHGIPLGEKAPDIVNCYVEIVPTDTVKYEMDKDTGILKIDRPNKYACQCPTLYGFLPRTYSGSRVGNYMSEKTGNADLYGDGDALDVCILTEKVISHGDIIVKAIPIGGFRLLDGNEADDKIIAVLEGDFLYGDLKDISECSEKVIERLRHYFLTYKDAPERGIHSKIQIAGIYGREEALKIIELGYQDYLEYLSHFWIEESLTLQNCNSCEAN